LFPRGKQNCRADLGDLSPNFVRPAVNRSASRPSARQSRSQFRIAFRSLRAIFSPLERPAEAVFSVATAEPLMRERTFIGPRRLVLFYHGLVSVRAHTLTTNGRPWY
jgi:hypothetical protein